MMQLDDFICRMGFGPAEKEFFAPLWKELQEQCSDGPSRQINLAFLERYWQGSLSDDFRTRAVEVERITASESAAALYADILDYLIMRRSPAVSCENMPLPEKLFGENAGFFQMMAVTGCAPYILEKYASLGIPEKYALDTLKYFSGAAGIYASGHGGLPGFNLIQAYWLRFFVDGKLFRLGRLEYLLHPLPGWLPPVFRRKNDGRILSLLAGGTPVGRDGRVAPGGEEVVFTAKLLRNGRTVSGTPVTPDGIAHTDREVTLNLDEWEPLACAWETVPSLHIPGGGGMTMELLKESLSEALDFFPRYLGFTPSCYVCSSWIFNPDWEELLPESNMVKFRKQMYTVQLPYRDGRKNGLYFIFGREDGDPLSYPADNTVRRAFHQLFQSGRPARSGAVLIAAEDIPHFGTEYYLRNFPGLDDL